MELYHYTGIIDHWAAIARSRYVDIMESNIRLDTPHFGPDVAWLTSSKTPKESGVMDGADIEMGGRKYLSVDKRRVRITVDVDDAKHWPPWSREQGIKEEVDRAMAIATGGDLDSWYVVERPVYDDEWVIVEDLQTGTVLWNRKKGLLSKEHEDKILPKLVADKKLAALIVNDPGFTIKLTILRDPCNPDRPCRPFHLLWYLLASGQTPNTKRILLSKDDNLNTLVLGLMTDIILAYRSQGWRLLKGTRAEAPGEDEYWWLESDGWDINVHVLKDKIEGKKDCYLEIAHPGVNRILIKLVKINSIQDAKNVLTWILTHSGNKLQ
jgi:hypothetical protein